MNIIKGSARVLGDEVSTDIAIDLPVPSQEDFSLTVGAIKQLLRDHGSIFRV